MLTTSDLVGEVRANAADLAETFATTLADPQQQVVLTPASPSPVDGASQEVHEHHARQMIVAAASILTAAEAISIAGMPVVLMYDADRPAWIVVRLDAVESDAEPSA